MLLGGVAGQSWKRRETSVQRRDFLQCIHCACLSDWAFLHLCPEVKNNQHVWVIKMGRRKKGEKNGQIFLSIIGPPKITAFKPWTIRRWEQISFEATEQIHQDNNRSEIMAGVSEEWVRPAGFSSKPCHQFATWPWASSFLCLCWKFLICKPVST